MMKRKNIFRIFLLFLLNLTFVLRANSNDLQLDVYKVQPEHLNDFKVVKKGTTFSIVLLQNVSTLQNKRADPLVFDLSGNDGFKGKGNITKISNGGRFSKPASLILSTNKLILGDGQEVNFSASSVVFKALHPPHANTSSLGLAQAVTSLSWAVTPLTFGTSLGISFLAGGLLSAYKNGISDFLWGGFNSSGFSFVESFLRKQPGLFLSRGSSIPFFLTDDLKINKGIRKEKTESVNLNMKEAQIKIKQLLEWGDLSGALELSAKTGSKEIYNEIIKKISL